MTGYQAAYAAAARNDGEAAPPQPDPVVNVRVPWVVDNTVDEAKSKLVAAGLAFEVQGDTAGTAHVVSQSIDGMVPAGTVVVIVGKLDVPKPVLEEVYLGYVDPQTGVYIQYPDAGAGQVPQIDKKGGQLQMLASVRWDTGAGGYATDQGISLTWTSTDAAVASVDPSTGLVTALKDGTVRIRGTTNGQGAIFSEIELHIVGQEGAYVKEVAIVKEDGTPYRDERILFKEYDGSTAVQLYVVVLYSDGTTKNTALGDAVEGLSWESSDKKTVYVGPETGRVKPYEDGSAEVTVKVPGGKDGPVAGAVIVVADSGKLGERNPSSTITFNVVYEKDDSGQVYASKTYDASSLSALGVVQQAYSQFKGDGNYQVLSAEGVYLDAIMRDLSQEPSEVSALYLGTTDSGNPWMIPGSMVFGIDSWYFPDYSTTGSMVGRKAPPMIATRTAESSTKADFSRLNGNDQFRLCIGTSGDKTDNSAQRSRYNISDVKIVMKGSPPTGSGGGDGPENPGDDPKSPGLGGGAGGPSGPGSGSTGVGSGAGNAGIGAAAMDSSGSVDKAKTGLADSTDYQQSAEGSEGAAGGQEGSDEASEGGTGQGGRRWQVYQMMSKAKSETDPADRNNPLEPFLLPTVLAMAAAGGTSTTARFRKELRV